MVKSLTGRLGCHSSVSVVASPQADAKVYSMLHTTEENEVDDHWITERTTGTTSNLSLFYTALLIQPYGCKNPINDGDDDYVIKHLHCTHKMS